MHCSRMVPANLWVKSSSTDSDDFGCLRSRSENLQLFGPLHARIYIVRSGRGVCRLGFPARPLLKSISSTSSVCHLLALTEIMQPQARQTLWLRHEVVHVDRDQNSKQTLSGDAGIFQAIMKSQVSPGPTSLTRGLPTNFTRSPVRRSIYGLRANGARAQATATAIENATATTTKHMPEPTVGKATPVKPTEYNYTKQMKPGNSNTCGFARQRLLHECYVVKPPSVELLAGLLQVLTE